MCRLFSSISFIYILVFYLINIYKWGKIRNPEHTFWGEYTTITLLKSMSESWLPIWNRLLSIWGRVAEYRGQES